MKSNDAKKKQNGEWLNSKRETLLMLMKSSGMNFDSAYPILLGLETEAEQYEMLRGLHNLMTATQRFPTQKESYQGMLSVRRTGVFSLTGWAESSDDGTTEES